MHIIIWIQHLIIHLERVIKSKISVMITLIWMMDIFFKDHEPLIAAAPHCTDHDHFYYKEKKLSFTKTEDVYKRSLQAAKKGKTLTFHWRGGYLTREVLNELLGLIRKAGEEKK